MKSFLKALGLALGLAVVAAPSQALTTFSVDPKFENEGEMTTSAGILGSLDIITFNWTAFPEGGNARGFATFTVSGGPFTLSLFGLSRGGADYNTRFVLFDGDVRGLPDKPPQGMPNVPTQQFKNATAVPLLLDPPPSPGARAPAASRPEIIPFTGNEIVSGPLSAGVYTLAFGAGFKTDGNQATTNGNAQFALVAAPIPLPAGAVLLITGLSGILLLRRRQQAA